MFNSFPFPLIRFVAMPTREALVILPLVVSFLLHLFGSGCHFESPVNIGVKWSHHHIVTLSHCHSLMHTHSHTVTVSHSQSHCLTLIVSHRHTGTQSHYHPVPPSYHHTYTPTSGCSHQRLLLDSCLAISSWFRLCPVNLASTEDDKNSAVLMYW